MSGFAAAAGVLGDRFVPAPLVDFTPATLFQRFASRLVHHYLSRTPLDGELVLLDPEFGVTSFGDATAVDNAAANRVVLLVRRPAFYTRVATRGDIGLAEAYMAGDAEPIGGEDALVDALKVSSEHA